MIVDSIVEIPKYGKYKYRYKDGKFERVRRLVGCSPENYGCITKTIAPDGSPMDIIILTNRPLKQGHARAKVIGILMREDRDDKVIAVPVYSRYKSVKEISAKRMGTIVEKWTSVSPLKRLSGPKEATMLIERYRKLKVPAV